MLPPSPHLGKVFCTDIVILFLSGGLLMKSTFFMYKVLIICFLFCFAAVAVKHSKGALPILL